MSKNALVVGAAGGVGIEVAKQLLAAGYSVIGTVLNDTEEKHLRATAPTIGKILHLDLSDADSVLRDLMSSIPLGSGVAHCSSSDPRPALVLGAASKAFSRGTTTRVGAVVFT